MVWMLAAESCSVKTALVVVPELPSTTVASPIVTAGTLTVALPAPTLLDKARSGSLAEMLALLVRIPGCVVWKVTLRAALPVLVRLPSEQTTAPPMTLQLPWDEVAETNVAVGGMGLVMLTPVAVAGPWFVAWIVKGTLLPTTTGLGAAEMLARVTSIE